MNITLSMNLFIPIKFIITSPNPLQMIVLRFVSFLLSGILKLEDSPTKLKSSNTTRNMTELSEEGTDVINSFQNRSTKSGLEENGLQELNISKDQLELLEIEKRKCVTFPDDSNQDNDIPIQQKDEKYYRSSIKVNKLLERKPSDSSPTKRRSLFETSTISRRENSDVEFYNAQITSLNNKILNQNIKIGELEMYRKENDGIKEDVQKSETARRILKEEIAKTITDLKQENSQLENQMSRVINEKEELLEKNAKLQNTINELSNTLQKTQRTLQKQHDLNVQNTLKLAEISDLKQYVERLQESVIDTENQKNNEQANYKLALEKFDGTLKNTSKTIETLNQEKKKAILDLCQVQQDLTMEKLNHENTQNELLLIKARLENAENYKEVITGLELQRDQLTQQLADIRDQYAQSQQLLKQSLEKLALRQKEFEISEEAQRNELDDLMQKLNQSQTKNETLNKELNQSDLNVSKLTTTMLELQQLVSLKADTDKQLELTERQRVEISKDKEELTSQLGTIIYSQDEASQKLLEVEKTANQLRQINEEQYQEIEQLTMAVIALKEHQETYIPTRGDVVDNALADYINCGNNQSRLKLLFIRESEGVYKFGSKRIYVKLEGGKIIIRVGGGFLIIDEFIEQYSALEIEKLARLDPMKLLSKNIAVNQAILGKCVNQIEKPKTQVYEVKSDANNTRIMSRSSSLQRYTAKGDY